MKDSKNELGYIRNMLKLLDTYNMVAIVGDSYNIYNFCELVGSIKDEVIEKTKNGKFLVIRPDSGDPTIVLPKMFHILGERFGFVRNSKGYKVLNNVRVIWGDGIDSLSLSSILRTVVDVGGWSADNIAFGMGGALLGHPQRDDQQFAMKASSVCINGQWREIWKDPITGSGKTSKRGKVNLWDNGAGEYQTAVAQPTNWTDKGFAWKDSMETYYENGAVLFTSTFQEVRDRSNKIF